VSDILLGTADEGDPASDVPSWGGAAGDEIQGGMMRRYETGEAAETKGGDGFLAAIVGDGVLLLLATAASLVLAGGFAMFLAASGEFLPHDIRYLGMSAAELCSIADCRIVGFMVHDRAAFGGALSAVGVLYAYLVLFPLRQGEAWAWWLLAISASTGFGGFLAYLGYGYLDTWHGVGTVLLLPVFVVGLLRSRRLLGHLASPVVLLAARDLRTPPARRQAGRACLLLGAAGTALGGLTILWVGITDIFVPEDLAFMGLSAERLQAVNPRLVPLMAHDRAGFGGAVFTLGLTAFFCLWCAPPTRALWEAMLVSGGVALAAAIGVHGFVGYTDLWHLAPALAAAASMIIGLALTSPSGMAARGPT
jgi:hypothetical protein